MKTLLKWYLSTSLVLRILSAFLFGSLLGGLLWFISSRTGADTAQSIIPFISPFGTILINMLKMIVIPVIFFSLVIGAASLPIQRFGRIGAKVMAWYFLCSFLAAAVGVTLALVINPGGGADLSGWEQLANTMGTQTADLGEDVATEGGIVDMLINMFQNPFQALAEGNFLPIIIFSIMFGLGIRVTIEASQDEKFIARMENLIDIFTAARDAMFKMVDWILEYSPIGVFALSIVNFSMYGPNIVGPYVGVTLGIIVGILVMVFVVYSFLVFLVTRKNPYMILKGLQEAMITGFITRSSAATLPVSMRVVAEELKVKNELSSFSLPLGATINMDGVCVHLPMFAVLAANMFGITLTPVALITLVLTTVLASIGAGGVPGGSLMLLFIILENMGLSTSQVAVIVALALGINPILDMFETSNNVTGDMVCTYVVAHNEDLIDKKH
ncbi:cation:dicarboxylase symporter family transporter [candidate division KSB1 bacterium]|nr:cation:dicarboxylase symporter family transporter [candidate division KSB1 bacterium]